MIGASVAYHLAHLGVTDVLLLERHDLTAGTTWHAAGLITSAGMTDETAVWMARYSRDLYTRLEAETGHSTGFREIGHLHLACTEQRLETLRRERAFQRGFGIDNVELSAAEVAELTPVTRVDDVLAASYVADEGRADPVGVATALAKGARQLGATVVTGVSVTGLRTDGDRVAAVLTDQGEVECETVVLAAGLWTRELARRCGIDVPLQAAEHYYLLTEPMAGVHRDLPVVEDPDRYGYYREEAGGLLVGLFEPEGAAVAPRRATHRLRLRHDRARLGADDAPPRARDVAVPGTGRRGPADVLLRPGVLHPRRPPAARPRPGGPGRPHRRRDEQPRHPERRRRRQRRGPVDRRRASAGRRHPLLGRAGAPLRDHPPLPGRAGRRLLGRALRRRRLAELPVEQRPGRTTLRPARQARRRRRPVRPVRRLGVPAVLRRPGPASRADRGDLGAHVVVLPRGRGARRRPRGGRRDGHVPDVEVPGAGPGRRLGPEPAVGEPGGRRAGPGRLHPVVRRRGRPAGGPHRHQARPTTASWWSPATSSIAASRRCSAARRSRARSRSAPT